MIKIAVVDDEPKQAARGARLMHEAFVKLGVETKISEYVYDISLAPDKVLSTLEAAIVRDRPHILVCDNKAGRNEAWGQTFIARMKILLPETVMGLLTREILKSSQFGLRTPNPDIIVDKGQLGGEPAYREYIARRFLQGLKRTSNISVEWISPFESIFSTFRDSRGRRASTEEVSSLLEQCLFDGGVDQPEKKVVIDRLAGGRSGSVVLNCHLSGELSYGVTGVVKISRAKEAQLEIENYNRFVKWVLPYTWKVEILGTGATEGMGAICYSFAFDGNGKPKSCTDLLRSCDGEIVRSVCSSIFNPTSKTWYSQLRGAGSDGSEYFQNARFFAKAAQIQEREEKLIARMSQHFGDQFSANDRQLSLFGISVLRPARLLFTEDWGDVEECVCHGDLNANNILVNSKGGGIAFIDFQNTGYHNIFRDFVSFESSVRIDWGGALAADELEELFLLEIDIAENSEITDRDYLTHIASVRRAAFGNFPIDSLGRRRNLYLLAAFVHFSWLVTRFDDWSREGYLRLMIGAFASLVALDRAVH